MRSRTPCSNNRGLALASAMFALVAMAILAAGLFTFADLGAKSVRNRESATRATHIAEAGVSHTLGLMRGSLRMHSFSRILKGSDNVAGNADDSLMVGWGLAGGDEIPLAGRAFLGHTYFVGVRDDGADGDANAGTDLNGRVRVRCRAVTADGATAEVEAIIGSVPMPGIAADGNLSFGNSNVIAGECGGIHANGNLNSSGGGPTIGTQASATGTVSGNYRRPDGSPAPKLNGQAEVVIPDLNPMNFCAGADFTLTSTGGVLNMVTGVVTPAPNGGWSWDAGTRTWTGNGSPTLPAAGTYCAQGNVVLSGNIGSSANPRSLSVLASGSIRAEGTPYLRPDHEDGIMLMAGGDIYLSGNNTTGIDNFQGLVYAGAQCTALGNAKLAGQLLCANGAQPAGSTEWIAGTNTISGNFSLTFDCSANVFNKRRVLYWYPRIGV